MLLARDDEDRVDRVDLVLDIDDDLDDDTRGREDVDVDVVVVDASCGVVVVDAPSSSMRPLVGMIVVKGSGTTIRISPAWTRCKKRARSLRAMSRKRVVVVMREVLTVFPCVVRIDVPKSSAR